MRSERRPGRRVTLAACMVYPGLTFGLLFGIFPQIAQPLAASLGAEQTAVMASFSVGTAVVMLASALVGRLLDRVAVATLVASGAAMLATGMFLVTQAVAVWQVALVFATLVGLGLAFSSDVTSHSVAVRLFPEKPGMMIGAVTLGLHLGGAAASLVFGLLLQSFDWRVSLTIMCVAVGVAVPLIALATMRGRLDAFGPAVPTEHAPGPAPAPASASASGAPAMTTRRIVSTAAWRAMIVGLFPIPLAMATMQVSMAALVADAGLTSDWTGLLVAMISIGTAVGTMATGWLADRVPLRILYPAMVAGTLFALFAFGSRGSPALLCTAAIAGGFAQGGIMPVIGAAIVRRFGARLFPRVFGLVLPGMALVALGPIAAAATRAATGSFTPLFAGFALLLLTGTIVMAREGRRGPLRAGVDPLPANA